VTDHLLRQLAPITDAGWAAIEDEATRSLRQYLSARPLVDFTGPLGWRHAAQPTGRVEAPFADLADGVNGSVRAVQPLVELRTPFTLSRDELDAVDRGAPDPDLQPVIDAARQAALAEDLAVFNGHASAHIAGMLPSSPHEAVSISDDYDKYPGLVAAAVAKLRDSGVGGPYGIALGARCYTGVIETTEHGGYPVLEHIRLILGGPIVWAPAVDGAAVVSLRGGDYELVCGQDVSIGYRSHTDTTVDLYLEESFTFVVKDDRATVPLTYPS
jgi:uncharacterized linocin/CFP29 family protein